MIIKILKIFLIFFTIYVTSVFGREFFVFNNAKHMNKTELIKKYCHNENISIATYNLTDQFNNCSNMSRLGPNFKETIIFYSPAKPYYFKITIYYKDEKPVKILTRRGVEFL